MLRGGGGGGGGGGDCETFCLDASGEIGGEVERAILKEAVGSTFEEAVGAKRADLSLTSLVFECRVTLFVFECGVAPSVVKDRWSSFKVTIVKDE